MKPIISSRKHIVQITLTNVAANAANTTVIVSAVQDPTESNPVEVKPGSIVKAVYVEMWYNGDGAQPPTITTIFAKNPNGVGSPNPTEFQNLHNFKNKSNFLEVHQGLVGDSNSNPVPFYRHWIKIPKGKQRMALGDQITLSVKTITEEIQFCGMMIFKSYT